MKNEKPTLLEVKEYFKNAEKVQCIFDKGLISGIDVNKIKFEYGEYWCEIIDSEINLWDTTKGYAKILTYKKPKEETFVISKEQIESLRCVMNISSCDNGISFLKEWFPSAFVEDKKELPKDFTGWVKTDKEKDGDWLMYFEKGFQKYGFDFEGTWTEYHTDILMEGDELEATPEEVKEALTKEAVKRGYVEGVWLKKAGSNKHMHQKLKICGNFDWFLSLNILDDQLGNGHIFDNGIWSEIIPTITKAKA